jgi:hypothetical protein
MRFVFLLVVAAAFAGSGLGAQAASAGVCQKLSCARPAPIRVADARDDKCRATLAACRARCPAEGQPGWDRCVTKCGEALEHCLGE